MIPPDLIAPFLDRADSLAPDPELFDHVDGRVLLRISQRFTPYPLVNIFFLLNYIIYFVADLLQLIQLVIS